MSEKHPNATHGESRTALYGVWKTMRNRCRNPKNENYARYGGRGIKVCPEWDASFESFRNAVGAKPGPGWTIERIDNDGDYKPGNVRWATHLEQAQNTRNVRLITLFGETMSVSAWSRKLGVSQFRVFARLRAGWSERDALLAPVVMPRKGQPKHGPRLPRIW